MPCSSVGCNNPLLLCHGSRISCAVCQIAKHSPRDTSSFVGTTLRMKPTDGFQPANLPQVCICLGVPPASLSWKSLTHPDKQKYASKQKTPFPWGRRNSPSLVCQRRRIFLIIMPVRQAYPTGQEPAWGDSFACAKPTRALSIIIAFVATGTCAIPTVAAIARVTHRPNTTALGHDHRV